MRKMKFWGVCFSLCLMAATTLFTSCGGDDDEIDPTDPNEKTSSQFNYVEPYLQWGASKEEVNNYMQNQKGFTKEEYDYPYCYTVVYYNDQFGITYQINPSTSSDDFTPTGLKYVSVIFRHAYEPEEVINKLENLYGGKFEIEQTEEDGVNRKCYVNVVVINGRKSGIIMYFAEDSTSIVFMPIGKDEL